MEELTSLSVEEIKELAKSPRDVLLRTDIKPIEKLVALSEEAKRAGRGYTRENGSARKASPDADGRIRKGMGRNNALTSFGGWLRKEGYGEDAIFTDLMAHNMAVCDPPLGGDEVRKIARSVSRYELDPDPELIVGGKKSSGDNSVDSDNNFQDLVELPDPEEFPITALPLTTQTFVREAAASVGCAVDYVGVSTLAALSAAIGDTRRIVLKKD